VSVLREFINTMPSENGGISRSLHDCLFMVKVRLRNVSFPPAKYTLGRLSITIESLSAGAVSSEDGEDGARWLNIKCASMISKESLSVHTLRIS